MGALSWWHWLIVVVVVMAVFGTKKLRNVGSDLGAAVKGFKDGMKDAQNDDAAKAVAEATSASAAHMPPPTDTFKH